MGPILYLVLISDIILSLFSCFARMKVKYVNILTFLLQLLLPLNPTPMFVFTVQFHLLYFAFSSRIISAISLFVIFNILILKVLIFSSLYRLSDTSIHKLCICVSRICLRSKDYFDLKSDELDCTVISEIFI